jgi:hypothetical protein
MIAGFPGVGKTYFFRQCRNSLLPAEYDNYRFIECDVRKFRYAFGEPSLRNPDFPRNYANELKRLYKIPFSEDRRRNVVLFTSSTELNALLVQIQYTNVYPAWNIENLYLNRWQDEVRDGIPYYDAIAAGRRGPSGAVPMSRLEASNLERNFDSTLLNYSTNRLAWRFELGPFQYLRDVVPEILTGCKTTRLPKSSKFNILFGAVLIP